ncbi:MAG: peptidyl-prolyl cis-trans isomerase [Candidatus Eisenbacteria bacterium]
MFLFEKLRKNTKIILWITVFAFVGFIFLVWGMDIQSSSGRNPMVAGKVNGQRIPTSYYREILTQAYEEIRTRTGGKISDADEVQVRNAAWDRVVNEFLINQELKRRKISASDAEVEYYLKHSPPPEVAQNPVFQTDGRFDPAKYTEVLRNPAYDLSALEAFVRSSIPIRKLEELVSSSAKVSRNEVRSYFEAGGDMVTFSYVFVDPRQFDVDADAASAEELRNYYNANKAKFRVPESANVRYIVVEKQPSAKDISDGLATANDLWREARAGTDFGELAEAFSEGFGAEKGGDVGGLLARKEMSSEVADVVFSLKVGEVSSPFRERQSWNLVKLEERTVEAGVEKARFRRIHLPVEPSAETVNELTSQVQQIREQTSKKSFQVIASEMGLEAKETGFFLKGGVSPILPREEAAKDFAFKNKVGTVSKPIETRRAWYFLEVVAREESRVPSLEEALRQVKGALAQERRRQLAEEKTKIVSTQLSQGAGLEAAARAASLSVQQTKELTRSGALPGMGREPAVLGTAFALDTGMTSPVIQGDAGLFIIRVDARARPDEALYTAQRDQMRMQLLQQKRMMALSLWMQELRKSARIDDYRSEVIGS